MGQLNPISPPLVLHAEDDRVAGEVTLGATYEGAPGLVHGAIISAIYDEVLALANTVNGSPGPTGRLTVHFRRPTPLDTPLRFEAWTERADERKVLARGRCLADGELCTEAEGPFVRIRRPG
jgi:acyl-coenzyme A thioesterase PaaI-like protein